MNADLPVTVDRALAYACHEGYPPGRHTMRTIREAALVRARGGWIEYSVVTLASPLATVAEGGAARARGGGDDLSRPPSARGSSRRFSSPWPGSSRRMPISSMPSLPRPRP
ncbi:hypothetical protein [Methanoculleus chikugoensis]|uniref:hypothetical protein n=1 Tax=Methanoculleus chikugoensis TaxID=118126 RepID=UPI000A6D8978|nr:hypothetical protein [Methanoculleus chikugoensis]